MFKLETFTVLPTTPEKLKPLLELANNTWFSWNWDAINLFEKLDPVQWKRASNNPIKMLCNMPQSKLEALAQDEDFVTEVNTVYENFRKYMDTKTHYNHKFGPKDAGTIAYFSCEFGLHESLPIYSGGLGVLAGDHLKSASDLGLPLIAVGLLYRQGYFRQGLDSEGMQKEFYPENDWFSMPVAPVLDDNGKQILLNMPIGAETVYFRIWKIQVGRIPLYLLDTDVKENPDTHRNITHRLYDSDREMRLRQEILLGMGGVQTIRQLGYHPACYHINEGHSAFLILERLKNLMKHRQLSFEQAKTIVWSSNVFTTHTPVPAGNEHFSRDLIKKYLSLWAEENLGLSWPDLLALGVKDSTSKDEEFCLTILALKFSSCANGVSKLHGRVSREMWRSLWPHIPEMEIPIGHITNGVHSASWVSHQLQKLLARYTNTSYVREIADFNIWKIIEEIPDHTLWKIHNERKQELIEYARQRLKFQLMRRGANADEINKVKSVLDPKVLTIGFARRFAPYKRGALIFQDLKKLIALVSDQQLPVQFVFAGKAHPADEAGKKIIKKIFTDSMENPELATNVVFLEDYDIDMARYLVQGVDVWLNTPRRPLEASGTSGMKAAMNGAPNLSVLDGWWDEAFDQTHGWAIGHGEIYSDLDHQDEIEANLVLRLIKKEVAPLFYDIDSESGLPLKWIQMMKKTIASCGSQFNAHRMVLDYVTKYYNKAEKFHSILTQDECAKAKVIASIHERLQQSWKQIKILEVSTPKKKYVYAGSEVEITAKIELGDIKASDLNVEVFHGGINAHNYIEQPERMKMNVLETTGNVTTFQALIPCTLGGRYAYTVRVLPGHPDLACEFISGLVLWNGQTDEVVKVINNENTKT